MDSSTPTPCTQLDIETTHSRSQTGFERGGVTCQLSDRDFQRKLELLCDERRDDSTFSCTYRKPIQGRPYMFDILVYLFKNYYTPQACPTADVLAKRLAAAGFEYDDIDDAIKWLLGLAETTENCVNLAQTRSKGQRVYAPFEQQKLAPEVIGFITFLETSDVLPPPLREIVIERALACEDEPVSLERVKVIALMVLWSQEADIDYLILEELLRHDQEPLLH